MYLTKERFIRLYICEYILFLLNSYLIHSSNTAICQYIYIYNATNNYILYLLPSSKKITCRKSLTDTLLLMLYVIPLI